MNKFKAMEEFPLMDIKEGIPLFYPNIPKLAKEYVNSVLSGRWIGQGPLVDKFENSFKNKLNITGYPVAVSSGTSALHLAYSLAGVGRDDEVISPLFTCTATNLPILYNGAKPVFCDVAPDSLNIDIDKIESLITKSTKAISFVDYGGRPNNYKALKDIADKYNLKLIADCAHALDSKWDDLHVSNFVDYTMFSFQAIKTLTTGDGGMLIVKNESDLEIAQRLRWFGIDRSEKQKGTWENDIIELGYKYQMTDIAASIGLAGLEELDKTLSKRNQISEVYESNFNDNDIQAFELTYDKNKSTFTPWMMTINCRGKRKQIMNSLRENNIESAQVHYRNDRYSVFGKRLKNMHNMDMLENKYLVLPLYPKMKLIDVKKICRIINAGW